jgi:hypothetical protein
LLYTRVPELDTDGRRFSALEDRMFEGKGAALASNDLEAAQRFHATLGLIYAERGTWRGAPSRNASDQLRWALRAAAERARTDGFHQPLPAVRALLARGLASGEAAAARGEAGAAALDAARAWLDSDDPLAADTTIAIAVRDPALTAEAVAPVRTLVLVRAILAQAAGVAGAAVQADPETVAREAARLCAGGIGGVVAGTGPADFMDRQRFKLLADCARMTSNPDRAVHARAAIAVATDPSARATNDVFTLVGAEDVRRFRDALQIAKRLGGDAMYNATTRTHVERRAHEGSVGVIVALPNQTVPYRLNVRAQDLNGLR